MNKTILAYRSQDLALLPLKVVLREAKLSPNTSQPQNNDEQLALKLIEKMKKPYRRPSPFSNWMGQPFPHEYKEMVAADVR
jgi:hypothetical protein